MEISSFFKAKKRKRNEEDEGEEENRVQNVDEDEDEERTVWRDVDTPAVAALQEEFQNQNGFMGFAGFDGEYKVLGGQFIGNLNCRFEGCPAPRFRALHRGKPKKDRSKYFLIRAAFFVKVTAPSF